MDEPSRSTLTVELLEDTPEISDDLLEIPLKANAWITAGSQEIITENGLENWSSEEAEIEIYLYISQPFETALFLKCTTPNDGNKISVSLGDTTQEIDIEELQESTVIPVASYKISGKGYLKIILRGVEKGGEVFADVSHILIPRGFEPGTVGFSGGDDLKLMRQYRKGHTVGWRYNISSENNNKYLYNEARVAVDYDPVGSHFVVIGFDDGQLGLQVNSETDKQIVFSIFSPEHKDESKPVPEENAVIVTSKNKSVSIICGFVGKGIGAQAVLHFNWSAGTVYKFLLRRKADPSNADRILYAAWFAKRNSHRWTFIAEFTRLKSSEHLTNFYSSLENTFEDNGHKERTVFLGNQWTINDEGEMTEITKASLICPGSLETLRKDFEGFVAPFFDHREYFGLKNGGFFDNDCEHEEELDRKSNEIEPVIDFEALDNFIQENLYIELLNDEDSGTTYDNSFEMSVQHNGWLTTIEDGAEEITENGLTNWSSSDSKLHIFFYVVSSQTASLSLKIKAEASSKIEVQIKDISKELEVQEGDSEDLLVGTFRFSGAGYVEVILKGLEMTGDTFGEVSHLLISTNKPRESLRFFEEQHLNQFPSLESGSIVKLRYTIPEEDVLDEYFFVEVIVPEKCDVDGSIFTAIGIIGCKCGLKVADQAQKSLFFSASSVLQESRDSDEPKGVDEGASNDVKVISTEPNASTIENKFSTDIILPLDWSVDQLYRFRINQFADPDHENRTRFEASFSTSDDPWQPIAEVSLPKTDSCMPYFYSEASNEERKTGHKTRKVLFGNQFIQKVENELKEVLYARLEESSGVLMEDVRRDCDVGLESVEGKFEGYYVKLGGFFDGSAENYSVFKRKTCLK